MGRCYTSCNTPAAILDKTKLYTHIACLQSRCVSSLPHHVHVRCGIDCALRTCSSNTSRYARTQFLLLTAALLLLHDVNTTPCRAASNNCGCTGQWFVDFFTKHNYVACKKFEGTKVTNTPCSFTHCVPPHSTSLRAYYLHAAPAAHVCASLAKEISRRASQHAARAHGPHDLRLIHVLVCCSEPQSCFVG